MEKITVVIIDDHSLVLESLHKLLLAYDDIEVVGTATSARDGIDIIKEKQPDVCVLDVRLKDLPGPEAVNLIKQASRRTAILCLSSFDSKYEISEMISAGAAGYLLKHVSAEEFLNSIRMVKNGSAVLHPEIARKILEHSETIKEKDELLNKLTTREIEVLELIGKGLSNKEIANSMHISEDTVKTYISRIFQKINVKNRVEAVAIALKHGVIQFPKGLS